MNAVPSQLPPLSPADSARLLRLFALHLDYQALAAELAPTEDLITLYRWSTRPDIAAYIAHHQSQHNESLRQTCIAALESILKSSPDPIESRRTATTLLRALAPRTAPRHSDAPRSHQPSQRPPTRHRLIPAHEQPPSLRCPEPPRATELQAVIHPDPPSVPVAGLEIRGEQQPAPQTDPQSASTPRPSMSLSEALAALGLPSFEDMDRLDDEEDDAELDGDFDDLDPPESDFNPNDGPPLPDTMPP